MSTLLLGHKGYLGSYLYKRLDCDIATGRWGRGTKHNDYEYVINCIAKTGMDWCEQNPVESFNVNAAFVLDLQTMFPKAKIINFSSYYVYDTLELATEESPLASNSLRYISHKIRGEQYNSRGINLRVGKIFGNPDSTQNRLTEYIINSDRLELDNHRFNPCSCRCVLKALQNKEFLKDAVGNFNLANTGVTTPREYANFILMELGKQKEIEHIERNPFPNYGRFAMSLDKIQQHLELDPWQYDMREYLDRLYV